MSILTKIRYVYVVLGMIGLAPAAILVAVSWEVMRLARRRMDRMVATSYLWLAIALSVKLVGHAGIAWWQLSMGTGVTLYPAFILLATMVLTDLALIGLSVVSWAMRREQERWRR